MVVPGLDLHTHTQKNTHTVGFLFSHDLLSQLRCTLSKQKYISVLIYGIYFFNYMYGLHCLVTFSVISAIQQSSLQWFTDDGRAKKQ